jgi:hypothetical protein
MAATAGMSEKQGGLFHNKENPEAKETTGAAGTLPKQEVSNTSAARYI